MRLGSGWALIFLRGVIPSVAGQTNYHTAYYPSKWHNRGSTREATMHARKSLAITSPGITSEGASHKSQRNAKCEM